MLLRPKVLTDAALDEFASGILSESADPPSPYARDLLLVFLRYLRHRRLRMTIDNVRYVVESPPPLIYRELSAALKAIPHGFHAGALTSMRARVRHAALQTESKSGCRTRRTQLRTSR